MKEYKLMDDYVIFKELGTDSIGINYRAGEIENHKPSRHRLLTVVHSFLATNPSVWKRTKILLEGIKKSNIPNLYSPDRIEVREDKTTLVYPLLQGKTFEQILEDATKNNAPINFDLAFSIAIAIADIIDTGSSIVVSGKKSFHGFLTPDNIIIDYDGKIFLKNYGIFPYLNQDDSLFTEMVKKYGAWIAPEFLRKEKPIPQSDIYHLGYIIYRMLTGTYFSCLPDEDFNAKFANISFTHHIHSSDKDFLTNIITFFKKTLHPDPAQRFANIREFKDYISTNFKIEELSSVTFNLAYFMNSLYVDAMEQEKKILEEEMTYEIPLKSDDQTKKDDALIEKILIGLEEKEKKKSKFLIAAVLIAIAAIAAAVLFYLNLLQQKKERDAIIARLEQQQLLLQQSEEKTAKILEEKTSIEQQLSNTEAEEQKKLQAELDRLQKELQQRQKREQEIRDKLAEDRKKITSSTSPGPSADTAASPSPSPTAAVQPEVTETPPVETKAPFVQAGQIIPLAEATVKPEKISGKNPGDSYVLQKKYSGRTITVMASFLIDENGKVDKIKILGDVASDIKSDFIKTLSSWKYKPAQKDNVNVKVWMPMQFTLRFKK